MKMIALKQLLLLLFILTSSLFSSSTIGVAGWYGEKFHGKKTASGEIFDMYDYTAAHPSFALGTLLKITNLTNHKTVQVCVTDRGAYSSDRDILISYQSALDIGIAKKGSAKVKIEELDGGIVITPATYPIDSKREAPKKKKKKVDFIKLQIASFSKKINAKKFIKKIEKKLNEKFKIVEVKHLRKRSFKVVILCSSMSKVKKIRSLKQYHGAYILK